MVTQLHADGCATFADGRREGPVDVIVYCTGYRCELAAHARRTSLQHMLNATSVARPSQANGTARCARPRGKHKPAAWYPRSPLPHTASLPPSSRIPQLRVPLPPRRRT